MEVDGHFPGVPAQLSGRAARIAHGFGDVACHEQVSLGVGVESVRRGIVEHGPHPVKRLGGSHVNDPSVDVDDRDALPGLPPGIQGGVIGFHRLVGGVRIAVGMLGPAGNG